MSTRWLLAAVALAMALAAPPAQAEGTAPLRLLGRTAVPGFEGDFDHFGVDLQGRRLFLAGEEQGTLEVFDLISGKHLRTVKGLGEPHAVHYQAASGRIVVSNSGAGGSQVLDGKTYAVLSSLALKPGADVMSHDASTQQLWLVTGGKNAEPKMAHTFVARVDAATGRVLGETEFDTDFTEAIAFEQKGTRAFVNVSGRSEIAVLDKRSGQVLATWPVAEGQHNAPMALDEANQRLFVVTRKPFKLVVINTTSGASVASFDAPQRTNELIYDRDNGRLYLTGDDHIAVFAQRSADVYEEIARVASDKGAKTAILIPELNRLFVAVAGKGATKAGVLRYEVLPASAR